MGAPVAHCPTCKREVPWVEASTWRPFCSERCKMVDLGAWFSEERVIPGEALDPTDPADQNTGDDPDSGPRQS
jgi:endogenous inhibitor of DNA gyrase (YacG/DUF329 family)